MSKFMQTENLIQIIRNRNWFIHQTISRLCIAWPGWHGPCHQVSWLFLTLLILIIPLFILQGGKISRKKMERESPIGNSMVCSLLVLWNHITTATATATQIISNTRYILVNSISYHQIASLNCSVIVFVLFGELSDQLYPYGTFIQKAGTAVHVMSTAARSNRTPSSPNMYYKWMQPSSLIISL